MDAANYKKLNELEQHFENPYGSNEGQLVVSEKESFKARLFREGRFRTASSRAASITTTGSLYYLTTLTPSKGHILYPTSAVVSADADMELVIRVVTGIADADELLFYAFVKAGTPHTLQFDGEVWCNESGYVKCGCLTTETGKKFWASICGVEVAKNV